MLEASVTIFFFFQNLMKQSVLKLQLRESLYLTYIVEVNNIFKNRTLVDILELDR